MSAHKSVLRPRVGQLENREVPAVVLWDGGGADTSWHNPLNWSTDTLPGVMDDAQIGAVFAATTVTVSQDVAVGSLTSEAAIRVLGGTLSLPNSGSVSIVNGTFENDGSVEIGSGVFVSFQGGGAHAGAFTVGTGSTLLFHRDHQFGPSSSLTGPGAVWFGVSEPPYSHVTVGGTYAVTGGTRVRNAAVDFTGDIQTIGDSLVIGDSNNFGIDSSANFHNFPLSLETLYLQGNLASTADISVSGTFDWAVGGTLGGSGAVTVGPSAALTMYNTGAGPRLKYLTGRTLVNYGQATLSDAFAVPHINSNSLVLTAGAGIENFGTFEIRDGRDLVDGGAAGAVVNHAGAVLRVTPGPRATLSEAAVANAGAIEVGGSYLAFRGGFSQTAGTLTLDGGTVEAVLNPGGLNIQGGSITGHGTLWGPVVNGGTLSPGNPLGGIQVRDGYTQSATGRLLVDLGGLTPGVQYDQIIAVGGVSLGGSLDINMAGYTPVLGDTFVIVDNDGSDAVNGTFASLPEGAEFTVGTSVFRISYAGGTGNDVTLTCVNRPPTASAGGPYTVGVGGNVILSAAGSSDPDQTTATLIFEWDFDGDGQYDDATGIAPDFSAAGRTSGTYTIGLRVTDAGGLSHTTTATIHVLTAVDFATVTITSLSTQIEDLINDDLLTPSQAETWLNKLAKARDFLLEDNTNAASGQITAVINQMNAILHKSATSEETAAALQELAAALDDALELL